MRRRSVLGAVFGVGVSTVAGCLDGSNADDTAGTDDASAVRASDAASSIDDPGWTDERPTGSERNGSESGAEHGTEETPTGGRVDDGDADSDGEDGAWGEAEDEGKDDDVSEAGGEIATYDVDDAVSMTIELDGTENQAVPPGDVETVSDVQYVGLFNVPYVSMTITDAGTESFVEAVEAIGAFDDPSSTDLHTYRDDERLHTSTLGSDLAEQVRRGQFEGTFNSSFGNEEQAEQHIQNLTAD